MAQKVFDAASKFKELIARYSLEDKKLIAKLKDGFFKKLEAIDEKNPEELEPFISGWEYDLSKLRFSDVMNNSFMQSTQVDASRKESFWEEMKKIDLDDRLLLQFYCSYWEDLFLFGDFENYYPMIRHKNLHDHALEIYTKFFSDKFDSLFHSNSGYLFGGFTKQDLIAFLCGIIPYPKLRFEHTSVNFHNVAESDEPVLITGETGTGKELHSKLIHYLSPRRNNPFYRINCSGIPENLLESELFGYEKGAFTGAAFSKAGILEVVGEGTLFLDEVADMSPYLQAKLLRVLETRDYYRLGDSKKERYFQGRIIAATNRNLESEILNDDYRFRPDLFYRSYNQILWMGIKKTYPLAPNKPYRPLGKGENGGYVLCRIMNPLNQ